MTNSANTMTIVDLERLLDVYGSDRSRWPVEARAAAGQLAARDRDARRLLDEAEALDRVLERAPLPSLAQEAALADRIVAAAPRSPRIVRLDEVRASGPRLPAEAENEMSEEGGNIVRLPLSGSRIARRRLAEVGGMGGLLAACLMLGVYVGLSNVTLDGLEDVAVEARLGNGATLAQLDPLDEDLL